MAQFRRETYSPSDIIPEQKGAYGITGLQNGVAWGTRNVLEQVDPVAALRLIKVSLKPFTIDVPPETQGEV